MGRAPIFFTDFHCGPSVSLSRQVEPLAGGLASQSDQALHGAGEVLDSQGCRARSVLVVRHCTGCEGRSSKARICPLRCPIWAVPKNTAEQVVVLQSGATKNFVPVGSKGVVLNNSTSTTGW